MRDVHGEAISSSIWISTSWRQKSRSIANTYARQRNCRPSTPTLSRLLRPPASSSTYAGAILLGGELCTSVAGQTLYYQQHGSQSCWSPLV
ncbi:hypothetical protein FA95DRAFT_695225 [Auriscalpium vulgare]|uniref:Uncharacterized protein n=1 Tax=Auriscalpium vulgare TaxID=40419 RepID=A0ACB8RCU9_9AGAM|nr:hypothetical protein FA95DRAFT_695225 [Auriscalpium vulgare]